MTSKQDDRYWMKQAYELAKKAQAKGEIPVGAVLIGADDSLLGSGYNQSIHEHDPTAHAEMVAIREAARQQKNYRLLNTTLYVTLEPCCMCVGAMIHARINRLVFATRDFKSGAAGSVIQLLKGYPLNHFIQVDEGILQQQCASLLSGFFKAT